MREMTTPIISALQNCRTQLKEFVMSPIDLTTYRDNLAKDLALTCLQDDELPRIVADHLHEIEVLQMKGKDFDNECTDAKDDANKMRYAILVKQIGVVKNKIADLSKTVNQLLRTSDMVVINHKRIKIEVERLDTIIFKMIKELPDLSSIKHSTDQYLPLKHARKKSLATMRQTAKELENIHKMMAAEQIEHMDAVQEMKSDIKRTKTEIDAINNGTCLAHGTFRSLISDRQSTRAKEINIRLQATNDEVEKLRLEIKEGQIVHSANLTAFHDEQTELSKLLRDTTSLASFAFNEIEAKLIQLKLEQSNSKSSLKYLEERWKDEVREEAIKVELEKLRDETKAKIRKQQEKEYFAALWIQLRWKAYHRRQLRKTQPVKGKKGKGGMKKKK